jgi:hypothetical protein
MTVQIDSDSANIAAVRFTEQGADPASPSAGGWKLYFKAGGLYYRATGGGVTQVAGDPLTAEGDLLYRHSGAAARLAVGTAGQVLGSNGTDPLWVTPGSSFTGEVVGTDFKALGLPGAVTVMRLVGATIAGAPATGTFALGDAILDILNAMWWVCTTAGSPGVWTQVGTAPNITTEGDLSYFHSGFPSRLPIGTSGYVLTSNGTDPVWTATVAGFANPMTTPADLIVGGTAGAAARLAKGSDGQVLTVSPSTHLLVWATPAAAGMTNPMTTRGDIITEQAGPTPGRLAVGAAGQRLKSDGTDPGWGDDVIDLNFVLGVAGVALTTGIKGYIQVNQALTIVGNTLLANLSGSVVVNVYKCTYANFDVTTHPVVGDKITASAPPTIAAAVKSTDATLTGWTTAIAAGDVLAFNVDSATTIERVTICLKCKKAA